MRFILVCLCLLLPALVGAERLSSVTVYGNALLGRDAILRLCGLNEGDSLRDDAVDRCVRYLQETGLFDSVAVKCVPAAEGGADLHVLVLEKSRGQFQFLGGTLATTLFGQNRYWFCVTPGYVRRYPAGRPDVLRFSVTLPYSYGVSADWIGQALPVHGYTTGLDLSAQYFPYQYSRYLARSFYGAAYLERRLLPGLSVRASLADELSKTWRVDVNKWKALDWQVLITDPGAIQDNRYSQVYPREENAPSVAFSGLLDKRDHPYTPSRGMTFFLEGRRYFILNLKNSSRFNFNQATGSVRFYVSTFARQTVATHLKAVVRDHFDPDRLAHRLIFYNDGQHFRGFQSLAGTNLLLWNWEYRVHLFGFDMLEGLEDLNLPLKTRRMLDKLSYSAEAVAYVDNGVFFGRVYNGTEADIVFRDIRLPRDLYTSVGFGGRLIYPKLGYVASAGITLFQHKEGLDDDFTSRVYGTLSAAF
ncbi:MAG: hypothetical protein V1913_12410 [Fibrobacterota bacterium]